MDLNKNYYKYTGIYRDVESQINACNNDEEKIKLYQNLIWHLQRGKITMNKDSKITQDYVNLMNTIAEKLSIYLTDDMDKDGDVDSNDTKLFNELNSVKNILSSLNITTEEPSEEVTEEPTEEVTEEVTEEPTEEVTEEVTEEPTE